MISVERSRDMDLVKSIITREDIWKGVSSPGQDRDSFCPPYQPLYLIQRVNGIIAGLFMVLESGDSHIIIFPEFQKMRLEIAKPTLVKAYEYFDILYATLSKKRRHVHRYALECGYKVVREDDENRYYEVNLCPQQQ